MSDPTNPIDDYIRRLNPAAAQGPPVQSSGNPIDEWISRAHPQDAARMASEEDQGAMAHLWHGVTALNTAIGEGVKNIGSMLAYDAVAVWQHPFTWDDYFEDKYADQVSNVLSPETVARGRMTGIGLESGAYFKPLEAIAQIPGLFTDQEIISDKAANFLNRAQLRLYTLAEASAKDAGLSDGQITGAYVTGNLIGYTIPVEASIKAASLVLRVPQAAGLLDATYLAQHAFTGTLVTDLTAGAIYGGVFTPGQDWAERSHHMMKESALFGVTRIMLNGIAMPFQAYRFKRARDLAIGSDLTASLDQIRTGEIPTVQTPEEASALTRMLSEESYISSSAAAQDILARSEDESALVQGIIDTHRANGTGGRIGGFSRGFTETSGMVDRFREQFSALKFDVARNADGEYDVIFGTKGLSNKQRAQLKSTGRFEGMKVYYGNAEHTYLGEAKRPDYVRLGRSDGTAVEIKKANITDTPRFEEPIDPSPHIDALYQDFFQNLEENTRRVASSIGAVSETDLIAAVRRGSVKLDDAARRAFDVGGAIIYPEELGLTTGEGSVSGVELILNTDHPAAQQVTSQGIERGLISRNASAGVNGMEKAWRITYFGPDYTSMGHEAFDTLDQALRYASVDGAWTPTRAMYNFATAGQVRNLIVRDGVEFANILEPPPVARFEQVFDSWARDRSIIPARADTSSIQNEIGNLRTKIAQYEGLSQQAFELRVQSRGMTVGPADEQSLIARANAIETQLGSSGVNISELKSRVEELRSDLRGRMPVDYQAMRVHFANRLRRSLWDAVPEEDRAVFESIRRELDSSLESGDLPFTALAHQKGFHAEALADGSVELREVSTGLRLRFADENVARSALSTVVRDEQDIMGGLLGLDANGMASVTGGMRDTDGVWSFGPQIMSKEFLDNIPFASIRNVRDWLISIEKMSGVPLFTKGFNMVDTGLSQMRNAYEPWAKKIEGVWKGLSMAEKLQVANFWRDVEGENLPIAEAVSRAKQNGLSSKQIGAWVKARSIFDQGYQLAGLPEARYIHNYYARVRPWVQENNAAPDLTRIFGDEGVPPEFQFFGEMARTGDLAQVEMDPEIVMHKWFRSLFFRDHVKEHWDRLAQLVDRGYGKFKQPALRVKDLPQSQIEQITAANPHVNLNDPVLAKPIRDVVSEYLTITRGNPGAGLETLRRFNRKLFSSLGIRTNDRVLEEFYNTGMSNMYGAAMAARPSLIARNMTQTIWGMYPRLGARFSQGGMERAMTMEGFNEAVDAGAIRFTEAGIPYGDAIFENMMGSAKIEADTAFGHAVAASVKVGLRAGYVSRKFAEKLMIPYSSGEQMGRAWAYWWQKLHTDRVLNMFETGRIGWGKFLDDGLPMFSEPIKNNFEELYRLQGKEAALRFIGKMGSDETHFIYGVGASPAWMQKPMGRLFGMFGTWPLWGIELYGRRAFTGTLGQNAAFWARTLALTGLFSNMMVQSGVNMWNWIQPLGVMGWAGGPMADNAINMKQVIDAPMDQKGAALKRLASNVGHLSLPGQLFIKDLYEAGQYDNPRDQFMRLMMGRPSDVDHYSMRFTYSGDHDPGVLDLQDPTIANTIRDPYMERLGVTYPGEHIPLLDEMTRIGAGRVPGHRFGGALPHGRGHDRGAGISESHSSFSGDLRGNMP